MFIQTEPTPNPATLKFIPGKPVLSDGTADFRERDEAAASPLASRLFGIDGVAGVFLGSDFISVTKGDVEWQHLRPAVLGAIMEHYLSGAEAVSDEGANDLAGVNYDPKDEEVVSTIKELLETRVRPAVANDGGDITFHGFRDGVVYLRMRGCMRRLPEFHGHPSAWHRELAAPFLPGCAGSAVRMSSAVLGALDRSTLNQLFLEARTHNKWLAKEVPDDLLRQLVDMMKMGPSSANCSPARLIFVKSPAAKERLKPHLSAGNRAKTMTAPVVAIIGYDLEFYERLPFLFPHEKNAKSWFTTSDENISANAFRNGTLQGAYLILAARALGLDTGPMSGFNNAGVDKEFFAGTPVKSNFLCSLGYGDPAGLLPRNPRLPFDEMARIE